LAWTIEYSERALKALRRTDTATNQRIVDYLRDVAALRDPKARGRALTGSKAGLWRYRVGDWRVICALDSGHLVILAIDIGHRSQVYRDR